jgi:ATP-dependent DNA ligase
MIKSVFEPCIPTKAAKVPERPEWIHEIKHDGYRLIIQREGKRVRLFTRNGHDWSERYPLIREAALRNRNSSFVLDGEAVLLGVDGRSDFNGLHSRRHDHEVEFYAFDMRSATARIFASCRCRCARPTWRGYWHVALTASTWRHSSRARLVPTCSGMPA